MDLKNANPNGCNAVINNVHLIFLFLFQKYWKLSKIKNFEVYFRIEIL